MCSSSCQTTTCPFAYTEESEQGQNYGCLPAPIQIMSMRVQHGKTWACHSDYTRPCAGAIRELKKRGLPYKVIDSNFVTECDDWSPYLADVQSTFVTVYHYKASSSTADTIQNNEST